MLEKVLKGCRKQHRKSQKELYKMFYGYGMSITLRYAGSRDEAVTILNDAFMKVFTNIDKYDFDRPFRPWLRQIIVNTAINAFRRHENAPVWEELQNGKNGLRIEEQITGRIAYREIIAMIQQLTPAYRTVFNLYVIEGFKHREIAVILDISEGTSKSNLAKAKRNLQEMVEKNLV